MRAAYGDRPWNVASRGSDLKDWDPGIGSADADNMFDMVDVRARARDLDRNEAWAEGYFDTAMGSALGSGLMPLPRVDWRVLGRTRE